MSLRFGLQARFLIAMAITLAVVLALLALLLQRQAMMQRAHGRRTVPQIFIGGQHVGGSDDIHALDDAGKLDALLAD